MKHIKIFLTSEASEVLLRDRYSIGRFMGALNRVFRTRGIDVELYDSDEDTLEEYEGEEGKYRQVGSSQMFVALFHKSAKRFVMEEFDVAVESFKSCRFPKVYVYFRDFDPETEDAELKEVQRHICDELGHYICNYGSDDSLKLLFVTQLLQVESLCRQSALVMEENRVTLEGEEVADMDKVSFAQNDAVYQRKCREVEEASERVRKSSELFVENQSVEHLNLLTTANSARARAEEDLKSYRQHLLDLSILFAEQSECAYSSRIAKARLFFDQGNVAEADRVLNLVSMKEETAGDVARYSEDVAVVERERELLVGHVEEFRLKADIVLANDSLSSEERLEIAIEAFRSAISTAQVLVDFEEERMAELLCDFADMLYVHRQYHLMGGLYDEALGIWECLADDDPEHFLPHVGDTLLRMGLMYFKMSQYKVAEKNFRRALEVNRKLSEENAHVFGPLVADTLHHLATLHVKMNDFAQAELEFQECYDLRTDFLEEDKQTFLPAVSDTLTNLAELYFRKKDYDLCEQYNLQALQIRRTLAKADPKRYLPSLSSTLNNLANNYNEQKDYGRAEATYKKTLEIRSRLSLIEPDIYLPRLADLLNNLASLHRKVRNMAEAESEYLQALGIVSKFLTFNPECYRPKMALIHNNLANLYQTIHRFDLSEEHYGKAMDIWSDLVVREEHVYAPLYADGLYNMGKLHLAVGRPERAKTDFQEAKYWYCRLMESYPEVYGLKYRKTVDKLENLN